MPLITFTKTITIAGKPPVSKTLGLNRKKCQKMCKDRKITKKTCNKICFKGTR